MSYESWRISFQSSEQAARAAYANMEALREEVNRFRALEAEAAEFVEVPIINRTKFTGDEPYVGWRGLGQSLNEALDERDALRAEVTEWKRVATAQAELHDEAEARADKLQAEVDEHKRRADAYFQTAERQGKRAEQLAEALQEAADALQVAGLPGNAKRFRSLLRNQGE